MVEQVKDYLTGREKLLENIKMTALRLPHFPVERREQPDNRAADPQSSATTGSGQEDGEEVKRHPWFASVDWDQVMRRELESPHPHVLPLPQVRIPAHVLISSPLAEHSQSTNDGRYLPNWTYVAEHQV